MKFVKKLCIFILVITLLPIQVFALTPEEEVRKNELLAEYESALVDTNDILDDLINYTNTHSADLSAAIDVELMINVFEHLANKDIAGVINHIDDVFPEGASAITDLRILEPGIRDLYEDKLPVAKEMLEFFRDNQYELKVNEFSKPIIDSVDVSLKTIILLDRINGVVNNSSIGEIDLLAITESEFEEEATRVRDKIDALIINQQLLLIDELESIANDGTISNSVKISRIMDIISYIEDVRVQGLDKMTTARASLSSSGSIEYLDEAEYTFDLEISESIIIAKKYLIDTMSIGALDTNLTNSELDQILLPVYAPLVNTNSFLLLSNTNRFLTSYELINNTGLLSSLINPNYGSLVYGNLVNGRVATGSQLFINNGTENVLSYTFIVKGDLLGRGLTDTTDLFRLIDGALGTNPISGIYRNAADMNDDTRTDISDIINLIDEILSN